jgi:hypothetical protein
MHPNAYLRTYWRADVRPEIFVAMSFDAAYARRYAQVIERAIRAITHHGRALVPRRADLSKTGDSILSDIIDGVAHSTMVLCDVSTIGHDSRSGYAYRNGNVMYEVGVALACRQPSEVLLIRDDHDRFLFDVSTVPHMHIDFANEDAAARALSEELVARLKEIDRVRDARVELMVRSLTSQERNLLNAFKANGFDTTFGLRKENFAVMAGIPRLLDKGLITTYGMSGQANMYRWTTLGRVVVDNLDRLLANIEIGDEPSPAASPSE